MASPVLVVISAKDCSACKNLAKDWPALKKEIADLKSVDILEIVKDKKEDPLPADYPASLRPFNIWWPMFALVNGDAYKAGERLDPAVVFNGELVGSDLYQRPTYGSYKYLAEWIKKNLDFVSKRKAVAPPVVLEPVRPVSLSMPAPKPFMDAEAPCMMYFGRTLEG
jgi:hypothetical protein